MLRGELKLNSGIKKENKLQHLPLRTSPSKMEGCIRINLTTAFSLWMITAFLVHVLLLQCYWCMEFSKFLEMLKLFVQEENYGDCNGLHYAGRKDVYMTLFQVHLVQAQVFCLKN